MNNIQLALVVSYLLISCYFFMNWLRFYIRHPSFSAEDKFLSMVMFAIVTFLWIIAIPMSCLKIFQTRKLEGIYKKINTNPRSPTF